MTFGERLLVSPELFPARAAGERWGTEALWIDFAGGPYCFLGLAADQCSVLREHFGELVIGGAPPGQVDHLHVDVFRVEATDWRSFDLAGWEYEMDFDYSEHSVRLVGLGFMGRLEWRRPDTLRGALFVASRTAEPLTGAFENFFRVLVAYRLLALGGLLIHSAGVVLGDAVHLFLGRSGTGKTTLSRLALDAGLCVLSDDVNAVVPDERGRFVAEKLPFAGELGPSVTSSDAYPLAGVWQLAQGEAHAVRSVSPSRAVASLLVSAPFINADPHRQDRLFEVATAIAHQVPNGHLDFARQPGVFALLNSKNPEPSV